jgi:ubiquinone/menaquinone biosynthesis C-methylase UbiE
MTRHDTNGSRKEFCDNWRERQERTYNHWSPGLPKNQIQFAFTQHWDIISQILSPKANGDSLEVGCGRGSLSSFFAEHGWKTTLLDYSHDAISTARGIFNSNRHPGNFICGDVNSLPFSDESFDAVTSIGLLEHFSNPQSAIREQWRVLRQNGWLICYIVPEMHNNVQSKFNFINRLLSFFLRTKSAKQLPKTQIFRTSFDSTFYKTFFDKLSTSPPLIVGLYPLPMISHSPEFPFSLLPQPLERILVAIFRLTITIRSLVTKKHGWICDEKFGQAFIIALKKTH